MPETRTPTFISGNRGHTENAKSPAYARGYARAKNSHSGNLRYLYICQPKGEAISIFKIKSAATIYYNCQAKTIQEHATGTEYSFYVRKNTLSAQIYSSFLLSRSRARCFLRESPAGSVPLQCPHFRAALSISASPKSAHLAENLSLPARKFVRESYALAGYQYYL